MVFKLLVVTLALLVIGSSAQRSANRLPLNRWDLYKYDLMKKFEGQDSVKQPVFKPCTFGTSDVCKMDAKASSSIDETIPTPPPIKGSKRAWASLDLIALLRSLYRDLPEAEIFVPDQYSNKPDK